MYYKEIIYLIDITQTQNSIGDFIDSESITRIFADKQSIRQSEFYQAMSTGLKPEVMFVIKNIDYNNQPRLTHNSKTYKIIRTYEKNSEDIELVCEGIVGTETRVTEYSLFIPSGSDSLVTSDGKTFKVLAS